MRLTDYGHIINSPHISKEFGLGHKGCKDRGKHVHIWVLDKRKSSRENENFLPIPLSKERKKPKWLNEKMPFIPKLVRC